MTARTSFFMSLLWLELACFSCGYAQVPPTPAPSQQNNDAPVQNQVPCLLTNNQNYAMRNLSYSAADKLAQLVEAKAAAQTDPDQKKALNNFAEIVRSEHATDSASSLMRAQSTILDKAVAALPDKTKTADVTTAVQPVIRQTVAQVQAAFGRPPDVSCSMSVLSWDEAHKALGRTIADTYLVVQITVANLNQQNEFLIHDAELAVDANGAQLARFQVGHEKELARSVLLYGQGYDRQHIFMNIVDGIGTILGAIVVIPSPSVDALTGATGAYHAGLQPALHNLFPDFTTRNLNTLNDLAFSAASASRIVVPKGGSVPFVVFIPVKPLEQACWLQKGYNIFKDNSPTSPCEQVCASSGGSSGSGDNCSNANLKTVIFKHWTPVQMQALERHAYALIAGNHIAELPAQGATLNAIVCAVQADSAGAYLAFLSTSGLTCSITGSALDTMSLLRFRSPDDPNTNLDAKVTVSGDNTTATAVLAPADVAKIKYKTYELYGVDKTGAEHDLNRSVNFRLSPTINAGQQIPAGQATLIGTNLNGVSFVVFYDVNDSSEVTRAPVIATKADGSAITFAAPANLTAGTYKIRLVLGDANNVLVKTGTAVTH